MRSQRWVFIVCVTALFLSLGITPVIGQVAETDSGIRFHAIDQVDSDGMSYSRQPSYSAAVWEQILGGETFGFFAVATMPSKWRGAPGVALLDYDGDRDLDIYVTNGPGQPNSLMVNQLQESGRAFFVDLASAAGVGAPDHDSSGVCFGDTDNDGDPDLFVLSNFAENRLFENQGDGTFLDLTNASGLGEDQNSSVSCSFGDVNGDGLLDVVVANTYDDMSNVLGIVTPFEFNQHNQLFLNQGDHRFIDVSATSGIQNLTAYQIPEFAGLPTVTWAIAMVDYDMDGDLDIVHASDQAGVPRSIVGGLDRGFIFILENDGTGHFTDVTAEKGTRSAGEWMGLSFGDLNHDGYLDMFGTNLGDWATTTITPLDPIYSNAFFYDLGLSTSRWFLGGPDGVFQDVGVGDLKATPFGWGTSMADYDNDGDLDIVYHGGMAFGPVVHLDNLGVVLNNDGAANFSFDSEALSESVNHQRRVVHGVAMGDLDGDGFSDIVSVSNFDVQESIPVTPFNTDWGSPFDGKVGYQATFLPTDTPGVWQFSGIEDNINGSLVVELNSGDNGNGWLKVRTLGTVDLLTNGRVNRDGIGAVVTVTPQRGLPTLQPIVGGASYASQDSLVAEFGLGQARSATVDILWPGGVRNRLYNVRAGSEILMPEIPCSYDDASLSLFQYLRCVEGAAQDLRALGIVDTPTRFQIFTSAVRAYLDAR